MLLVGKMRYFIVSLAVIGSMWLSGCSGQVATPSPEIEPFLQECEAIHERCEAVRERITAIDGRVFLGAGRVSYYADFFEGRTMANGSIFSNGPNSIAHRTLPFGTIVYFSSADCQLSGRRLSNSSTVYAKVACGIVRDRGPFHRDSQGRYDREFDLSQAMFSRLAPLDEGLTEIEYGVILP